jgi:dipeptidyl aminopeptidase/acylaminoacyl peptidase
LFPGLIFGVLAPENYLKNSALHHAKGGKNPTLFMMGNPLLGGGDAEQGVHKLYAILKEQGGDTEFVEYLDEGHCLIR